MEQDNVRAAPVEIDAWIEEWPLRYPFRITGYEWTVMPVLVVELRAGDLVGRGECSGVYYLGDTPQRCRADIERVADRIREGAGRDELLTLLPRGGARNALDCALWDLEAKRKQLTVWQIVGVPVPHPVLTTCTLGADEPSRMAERATYFDVARALKLKLTGDGDDAARVRAVRDARPDVWLGVDANQGFTRASLALLMPALLDADVALIEQPFPLDADAHLDGLDSPIPIAADESAQDIDSLPMLAGRVDVINIKLDKCGGLTRGLAMEREARRLGMRTMVGCMGGTSLAMAPAFILAQRCDIADLDGPLLLASDRDPGVSYGSGMIFSPEHIWGNS